MQNPLRIIYPDLCAACGEIVEMSGGLCAQCWSGTPFLDGLVCDACGDPLLGEAEGARPLCDRCIEDHPPWDRGRAVMEYRDTAKRMVLGLKHGDRMDLVGPVARWMAARAPGFAQDAPVIVPIPLHWTRLIRRRYNQSALLARELARLWKAECVPDALLRTRRTKPQENMTRAERETNQTGAMEINPARAPRLSGRNMVVVDDVSTSGATFRAATRALRAAEVTEIRVLSIARVVRRP